MSDAKPNDDTIGLGLEKLVEKYDESVKHNKKAIAAPLEQEEQWVLQENITFYYYVDRDDRHLIKPGQPFKIIDQFFDPDRPCVFITHGWQSNFAENDWMEVRIFHQIQL